MRKTILLILFLTGISALFSQQSKNFQKVIEVLSAQEKAWNEGNIDAFMEGYWHSDSLTFVGKNGVKKGWTATRDGYIKGYPDKETMGKLKFDILKTESLGKNAVHVIGRWTLFRSIGDVGGYFSLIFKKMSGKWYIISDHTS